MKKRKRKQNKKKVILEISAVLFVVVFLIFGIQVEEEGKIDAMINEEVLERKMVEKILLSQRHTTKEAIAGILENTNESLHTVAIKKETEAVIFGKDLLKDKVRPDSVRAIYMTAATIDSKRFDPLIDQLIESGGNAVVLDIELGGGKLAFIPKNEFLKTINPGSRKLNHMKEIVDKLHKKGIYVIARQVIFNDPYIAKRKPEWRIEYRWNNGLFDSRWLDPSRPGGQNYNLMIMEEVADFGFDEIQFDYIRFPATNHNKLDYYYDEENFTRSDVIIHFLKKAKRISREKGVFLSVDVFGAAVWGDIDWRMLGQSVPEMASVVDVIYPMTYPSHFSPGFYGYYNMNYAPYDIVHDSIQKFIQQAGGQAKIGPWIQGFPLKVKGFGSWYVEGQVKGAYGAGSSDFLIWSPGNIYTHSWSSMGLKPEDVLLEEAINE